MVDDNGRTDVQTDKSVPIIFLNTNIAQTGHGSLQVMFCFVFFRPSSTNTPADVPPDILFKSVMNENTTEIRSI